MGATTRCCGLRTVSVQVSWASQCCEVGGVAVGLRVLTCRLAPHRASDERFPHSMDGGGGRMGRHGGTPGSVPEELGRAPCDRHPNRHRHSPLARPDHAAHWLIDDTSWDHHPPVQDIELMLRDQSEVDAINAVLDPLLAILDQLGPTQQTPTTSGHRRRPEVRAAAARAGEWLARSTHDAASC